MSQWRVSPGVSRSANGLAITPVEMAALAAAGIALGVIALVWGAAAGSGWLVHQELPELSFSDAAAATWELGCNELAWDPAWPPEIATQLGGPVWFWAVFSVEVIALSVAATTAVRFAANARQHRGSPDDISAQWARRARVRKLLISRPDGRRVTLGRVDGRLVATEERHSVIIFGPTQSGKTTSLVVPALLEWDGPVVATSAKSDILSLTRPHRQTLGGRTWLFDPTRSTVMDSDDERFRPGMVQTEPDSWSPLHAVESITQRNGEPEVRWRARQWGAARESAKWLVHAARTIHAGQGDSEFWYTTAEKLLAPLLFAAAVDGHTISHVMAWIDAQDHQNVAGALERSGINEARQAWEACHRHEHRILSGSYTTLEVVTYAYGDPNLLALSQATDIAPRRLLDGKANTLFVVSPSTQQERLRPVFSALVSEVIHTAFEMAANSPTGRIDPPLLVVLDEAANIAPLQNLDQVASMGAGLGIQLVTAFQDLGQVEQVYGHHRATTVANNHRARILLPGVGDTSTLNYMSALIGDQVIETTSTSRDDMGARSTTDVEQLRPLAPPGWLRTLPDGQAVCVYGNLDPIRLQLRSWYEDKALGRLVDRHAIEHKPKVEDTPAAEATPVTDPEAQRYWAAVQAVENLGPPPEELDPSAG